MAEGSAIGFSYVVINILNMTRIIFVGRRQGRNSPRYSASLKVLDFSLNARGRSMSSRASRNRWGEYQIALPAKRIGGFPLCSTGKCPDFWCRRNSCRGDDQVSKVMGNIKSNARGNGRSVCQAPPRHRRAPSRLFSFHPHSLRSM